jgi:acyl-CoA synthetase (AMP-forming)/AMP-acid ligase II
VPGESLFEALAVAANSHADQPAFTFLDARLRGTTWSFQRLFDRVGEIAHAFAASGVAGPVGILIDSQEAQVLHYLAALARGLTPALLTPYNRKLNREYYTRTLQGVLKQCSFGAIVTDLDGLRGSTILRPYSLDVHRSGTHRSDAPGVEGAAFLQFSSGTTGIKRGVLVTDAAALAQLRTYARAIALHPGDCIVSWLPLYHDMGFITSLHLPLMYGVHSVMMAPADWVAAPSAYLHAVSRYRGTLSWHPNFAYRLMADRIRPEDLGDVGLSSVRGLVNCSEPVTASSQEAFLARFAPLGLRPDAFRGCYAMAETTFAVTHGEDGHPEPAARRDAGAPPSISVGRALPSVDLQVVAGTGAICGDGEVGELRVRSPFNATGYYNNPDATAQAFAAGWYRTGDLGFRQGDRFFVCGRKKDLLIVAGVNVHPNDVEDLVSRVDGVQPGRVAAFGAFDARLQTERMTILFELRDDAADAGAAITRIRQEVAAAFQITVFDIHRVPPRWLVKSSAGKMARSANREKWQQVPRLIERSRDPPSRG